MPYDIIVGRGEDDKKKLGMRGLIRIGKGYVKMGQYNSLSNNIYLDVAKSHVILIAGKRGSGKSYTMGVMTEEMADLEPEVSQNIASLIFDTMGIYWTMKLLKQGKHIYKFFLKNIQRKASLSMKHLPYQFQK